MYAIKRQTARHDSQHAENGAPRRSVTDRPSHERLYTTAPLPNYYCLRRWLLAAHSLLALAVATQARSETCSDGSDLILDPGSFLHLNDMGRCSDVQCHVTLDYDH